MLGVMGGALGLGLAYGAVRLLIAAGPASLPRLSEIAIDPRALAFTLIISLLSGLLFGFIPALKYARGRISLSLRGGGRTLSESRERHRARNILVVGQVALALILLVSSGLMIRTFQALRNVEPGFTRPEQIETVRISFPAALVREPERVARMQNDIVDKLATVPGVTSVAFTSALPLEGAAANWDAILAEDKTYRANEIPPLRLFKNVSPGFFKTLGTRLIAGRDYTWTDLYGRRPVVIVSENLARELWGTAFAALGKRIGTGSGRWREVIGVVQDVRDNGVRDAAPATVYWPSFEESLYSPRQLEVARTVTFTIRTGRAGTESFLTQAPQAVWSVNANLSLASVRTMQDIYNRSLGRTSFTLVMLGIAGAMALVLGLVGIYGVISYAVSQRRREIGIRLALGAQPGELKRMFVRHGLVLATAGVAIGLTAAMALKGLMSSLLFGISPMDPVTYAAVPVVLVMAATLASYLPARRASMVDPVEALKAE
jgi:predicted permease